MSVDSNFKGGPLPAISRKVKQEVLSEGETQTFEYNFDMITTPTEELTITVTGITGEDENDFNFKFKLKAGDTASACTIERSEQ